MLCSLVEPRESAEVFQGWAAWVILDYVIDAFVGDVREGRVLTAVIGLIAIALYTGTCKRDPDDPRHQKAGRVPRK